jgi:transcriptional regulator with XRE-family HTH domain
MLAEYIVVDKEEGQKIKEIRIKLGLTQVQTAKKAGISISSLSRIERGKGRIDINTICAISEVFKIFPVQLIFIMHGFAVYPQ